MVQNSAVYLIVSKREIPEFQRVIDSYVSELYERNDTYVLAFAGTADMDDAIDDVLRLIGRSQQYSAAAKNARILVEALGKEKLSFAGHSLGGGLATAAALATGARAITFNPAWLTAATIKENELHHPAEVVNYVVMGEALDVAQRCGKSFKDAKWNLPFDLMTPIGSFVFLNSAAVLKLPQGVLDAHKMCVVIEALKNESFNPMTVFVGGTIDSLLNLLSSVYHNLASSVSQNQSFSRSYNQGPSGSRRGDYDTSEEPKPWEGVSKAVIEGYLKNRDSGK